MSDAVTTGDTPSAQDESTGDRTPAPPIESRFLFVDVAALRAKQLRRGAKSRIETASSDEPVVSAAAPAAGAPTPKKIKAERVAMMEVRGGLVEWQLPDFRAVFDTR